MSEKNGFWVNLNTSIVSVIKKLIKWIDYELEIMYAFLRGGRAVDRSDLNFDWHAKSGSCDKVNPPGPFLS